MGDKTAISWCDMTFNPWWGCTRVSEACRNCYAQTFDNRVQGKKKPSHWGPNAPRKFFGDKHWNEPYKWNATAGDERVRRRVFCASMADVFEVREDLIPHRAKLWRLIQATPHLDWLLLTKRPENMAAMLPWMDRGQQIAHPWPNVWCGTTAEDNEHLEQRVLTLRAVPAKVRFVSCEPILEGIAPETWDLAFGFHSGVELGQVHWLIVGDESGHGARPAQVEWIRTARDAAQRHDVAFHFKQWAGREVPEGITSRDPDDIAKRRKIHLPLLDGRAWVGFPR